MSQISVVTPSRNYARFIRDAIDSVQQQGISVEHVVQDSCSDDGTLTVLEDAPSNVLWQSEKDGGQSDGLNRALARASSPWIAWLNADEFYLPGALSRLVEAAHTSQADVVYGDAVFVDVAGRFQRVVPQHALDQRVLRWYGPFISTCCVLIRREVLPNPALDERFRRVMDWVLYLRLVEKGARFHHVRAPIGAFRVHDARVTATPHTEFMDEFRLLHEVFSAGPLQHRLPIGKLLHRARKAVNGAYVRQRAARAFRGEDFRWFAGAHSRETVARFVARCYAHLSD